MGRGTAAGGRLLRRALSTQSPPRGLAGSLPALAAGLHTERALLAPSVSSRPAWRALTAGSLVLASASASSVAAAEAAPPPEPANALPQLEQLSDVKEVVLYQYEVCPFCNKVPRALSHVRHSPPPHARRAS